MGGFQLVGESAWVGVSPIAVRVAPGSRTTFISVAFDCGSGRRGGRRFHAAKAGHVMLEVVTVMRSSAGELRSGGPEGAHDAEGEQEQ